MATNTHGGPRPPTRPDDGRHHNGGHTGTGPKPKSFTVKLGDVFSKQEQTAEGKGVIPSEVWTCKEITRTHLIFENNSGDRIRLIR